MTDFIEVYDNVLSKDFCSNFINQFEASPHKNPGRTGSGVDTSKKLSEDIYLNEHQEFHPQLQTILHATTQCVSDYVRFVYDFTCLCCLWRSPRGL